MIWILALGGLAWVTLTEEVEIIVETTGCAAADSLFIYEFNGLAMEAVASSAFSEERTTIKMPESEPRFYYIGTSVQNLRPVIIGTEKSLRLVVPNCRQFRNSTIEDSPINQRYDSVKTRAGTLKTTSNTLAQQYRQLARDPEAQARVYAQMEVVDQQKLTFLDSLQTHDPYMANVLALNLNLFYPVHGGDHSNEIDFFAETYFQFVDWKDPEPGLQSVGL